MLRWQAHSCATAWGVGQGRSMLCDGARTSMCLSAGDTAVPDKYLAVPGRVSAHWDLG